MHTRAESQPAVLDPRQKPQGFADRGAPRSSVPLVCAPNSRDPCRVVASGAAVSSCAQLHRAPCVGFVPTKLGKIRLLNLPSHALGELGHNLDVFGHHEALESPLTLELELFE